MFFFRKKKKEDQTKHHPARSNNKVLRMAKYNYSLNFRGTKRISLVSYGSDTAMSGIDALKIKNPACNQDPEAPEYIFDLKGSVITVKEIEYGIHEKCIQVFVNQHHIGSWFSYMDHPELMEMLINGSANTVHIEFKQSNVIGLDDHKNTVIEKRYIPQIFIK